MTRRQRRGWGFAALAAAWAGLAQAAAPAEPGRVIEGTVARASRFPDAKRNTYADCLYTVRLNPPEGSAEGPVLLVLPAFMKRVPSPESRLKAGQRVRLRVRPFEDMPEDFQGIQMADDIKALDLPLLAGWDVEVVERFGVPAAGAPPAPPPAPAARPPAVEAPVAVAPLPPQPEAAAARARQIAGDRGRIERLLARHGDWASWAREVAPLQKDLRDRIAQAPGGYLRKGKWVLGDVEGVFDLTLSDDDAYYRFALEALKSMKAEFARAGTDLIVAPIPMRQVVYASKFVSRMPEDGVLHPYWLKFHLDLLRQDVETIDLEPAFQAAIETHDHVYLPELRDGHPGCDGARVAAQAIADRLGRYAFAAPRQAYTVKTGKYHRGDLGAYFPTDGIYPYEQVLGPDGQPAVDDPRSEVLMIGDSMLTAPQGSISSMALGVHAMRFAGFPFAFLKRAGAAPDMSIHLARIRTPDYFSGRRVCVFVHAFEYFAARNKHWSPAAFVSPHLPRPAAQPAAAAGRSTVAAVLEGGHLGRLAVDPPSAATGGESGLVVNPSNRECRIAIPRELAVPGREMRIGLRVHAAEPAVWKIAGGGSAAGDVLVPPGPSGVAFTLPPSTGGWSGVILPAGSPAVTVLGVEAWEAGQAAPEEAFAPETSRKVARYNSVEDFAGLAAIPPGRTDERGILHLDAAPGPRTLELPPLRDPAGRPPRWLLVGAEADAPFGLEATIGGQTAGALAAPAGRCRMIFVLPAPPAGPSPILLRLPAGAPPVRISTIELRSDAGR